MRPLFVNTSNVGAFTNAMKALQEAPGDKMALVTGAPGRGKTRTAIWYTANTEAIYLRAKNHWKGNFRYLLRELVFECGCKPAHRADDLFKQGVELLRERSRILLIDEADYLDNGLMRTARDLHDLANVPVVFIGVSTIAESVVGEQAIWTRVLQTVSFQDLQTDEIPGIVAQLCEVPISDEAAALMASECRVMRDLLRYIQHIERIWRGRSTELPAEAIKGFKARVIRGRSAA